MTPEQIAEKDALEDLLRSPGWPVYVKLVAQEFSAERCIADIDAVMAKATPAQDQVAVVTQIRAAYLKAKVIMDLPHARLRQLGGGALARIVDEFAQFRRAGR